MIEILIKKRGSIVLRILFFNSIFALLLLSAIGCNNSITGSESETSNGVLNEIHKGGPDCSQSACHPYIGAGGTIYDDAAGTTPLAGAAISLKSLDTDSVIKLTSDELGNFYHEPGLTGYYIISVNDSVWSSPHELPVLKGCNSCHTWPPINGAMGRIS